MTGAEVQTGELMKNKTTKMIEYIRKNKIPIGCLAAVLVDNQIYIGFSLCDKNDEFSKKTARDMAEKRALRKNKCLEYFDGKFYTYFPHSIKKNLERFVEKVRYKFRVAKIANYCDSFLEVPNENNVVMQKLTITIKPFKVSTSLTNEAIRKMCGPERFANVRCPLSGNTA